MLGANAGLRLAYGLGAALAPDRIATLRFAPALDDRPEARLFVRGVGGHMVLVGALGLAALRRPRLAPAAIAAAVAIDIADVGVALIEAARRGRLDPDLSGGLVFSGLGALSATYSARS
jgi:hypothetical protein